MGPPGGFFKKLHAKSKRAASRRQRGTKGASKEERRRKQNERVEVYAAKREAAELAAVSSSSDDDGAASSDSEAEAVRRQSRSLEKLRRLLHVGTTGARGAADGPPSTRRPPGLAEEMTYDGEEEEGGEDGEDWRLYLKGASAPDAEAGDEEGEESEEDEEMDDDLLMDDEEDEEDGESVANPLFEMDGMEELSDTELLHDGDEEDDGDEGSSGGSDAEMREDEYVAEDEEAEGGGATGAKVADRGQQTAEQRLLEHFQLGTSSIAALQQCGVLNDRQHPALSPEKDRWLLKYHLDKYKNSDTTPWASVPIPPTAVASLEQSNEPLRERAAAREAGATTAADRRALGLFFVSAEEYEKLQPQNMAVYATTHAKAGLLHPPFDLTRAAAPPLKRARATGAPPEAMRLDACPDYLHPALWEKWQRMRAAQETAVFTYEERGLLDLLQGYPDVLDTLHCWQNDASRREIYVLHLLNHWFKARSVVLAHDAMLAAHRAKLRQPRPAEQEEKERGQRVANEGERSSAARRGTRGKATQPQDQGSNGDLGDEEELELRDRGFSKTRLLFLCPMRNEAYKVVDTILAILGADESQCPKLSTFREDFSEIAEAVDPTFKRRSKDYQRLFDGNIDDSFCVGIRLEPDRLHVYSHPLNSDLLICSPLGLRRRIEKSSDVLVSLSSIEVCVVAAADVLQQQNWDHLTAVLAALNKRPTDTTHGLSDLRRVYAWALEGRSGRHRQTIFSTDINNAVILSAFRTTSVNSSGKVLLQRQSEPGVLSRVMVPVRQYFLRFTPTSLENVDDDRFKFFTQTIYASRINSLAERDVRTIIFVPSYFDFVRIRNYLHREYRDSFVALSEYTSLKQQRRALGQFSDLERPVLLVTERFYFFKRYFVKMAEVMVFYAPPSFPDYYASLTNRLVATSPNACAMTLYCRYDSHELNRIVGSQRVAQLLERPSAVFSFLTS